MENDEIICGTCLDTTDEKLYNIKDLILIIIVRIILT